MVIVFHRGPLTEKLRIVADIEAIPDGSSGMFLKNRNRHIFCRPRQRRASKDDCVRGLLVRNASADIFTHSFQMSQIEAAVGLTRRPDADERDIRVEDRLPPTDTVAFNKPCFCALAMKSEISGSTIGADT